MPVSSLERKGATDTVSVRKKGTAASIAKRNKIAVDDFCQWNDVLPTTVLHAPGDFNSTFATYATSNFQGDNEVQQFAIELIAKAFDVGASDIHIVDFGTYTIIKFRCHCLLVDHTQLSAERGKRLIATIYQILAQSSDAVFSPTERQDGRIVQRKYLPPSVHGKRGLIPVASTSGEKHLQMK